MNTKEKIVTKALKMFNERGIEYVGLREIAATLGIRVSNITYYFPTKDDLVNQLSINLGQLNSSVYTDNDSMTITGFLEMHRSVFRNQLQYRCLLLSFVHLIEQNKKMAERYKKTENKRRGALAANLVNLERAGYLMLQDEKDQEFLVSSIVLVARFWISEAQVSYRDLSQEQQIRHYLFVIARLLQPYCTAEGEKQLQIFLEG